MGVCVMHQASGPRTGAGKALKLISPSVRNLIVMGTSLFHVGAMLTFARARRRPGKEPRSDSGLGNGDSDGEGRG
ncbi:hypothetical protein SVAN01_11724 [Stagonosporopsis vannaccii]|nr:hypothetical protein SVAN01_11724 [Stagonosporopsis vannaccii]